MPSSQLRNVRRSSCPLRRGSRRGLWGDLVISADLTGFGGHLLEWLAVDIVDVSDGWKLKPGESCQIRKVVSIKVDVTKTRAGETGRKHRCANEKTNEAPLPFKPPQPAPAYFPNRGPGAYSDMREPDSNRHRRGPSWRWSRYAHGEVAFANGFSLAIGESRPSAGSIVRATAGTQLYRL
jgi:hypothetical protein